MSEPWQGYVDTVLIGSGKVKKAVILGLSGGILAQSASFNLSTAEQNLIVSAFADPEQQQAIGVTLAGEKFFVLQATEEHIYGKNATNGCVIVKTMQAILVSTCDSTTPDGLRDAVRITESLGDYIYSLSQFDH